MLIEKLFFVAEPEMRIVVRTFSWSHNSRSFPRGEKRASRESSANQHLNWRPPEECQSFANTDLPPMVHGVAMTKAAIARRVLEPSPNGFLIASAWLSSLTLMAAMSGNESLADFTISSFVLRKSGLISPPTPPVPFFPCNCGADLIVRRYKWIGARPNSVCLLN